MTVLARWAATSTSRNDIEVGIDAIAVLERLVRAMAIEDWTLSFIEHRVTPNWRETNPSPESRAAAIDSCFDTASPLNELRLVGSDVAAGQLRRIAQMWSSADTTLSVVSRIHKLREQPRHLALMNLHPESETLVTDLERSVRIVSGLGTGAILSSGRYFHFYSPVSLSSSEWLRFLSRWLMPTVVVSPRYIGHCLQQEFAALRLLPLAPLKPMTPVVVSTYDSLEPTPCLLETL